MMRCYTVHARAARLLVVEPESFSWPALLLGPLWLAGRGAWLPAALDLALWLGGSALWAWVPALRQVPALGPACAGGLLLLQGLFGHDLVRWSLRRRGFAQEGVVAGRSRDEALLRLVDAASARAARSGRGPG